jgi:hypothetical protein
VLIKKSAENGQVLVLLVLAFVALLGFAALAIDGGMVYADKRRVQNGADAASLAGGGAVAIYLENNFVNYNNFTCTDNGHPEYGEILTAQANARSAAISRAADNDYVIDDDISDFNGVATSCGITSNGSWPDKHIDITATITSTTPTNFAHLIYGGPLRTRATAVTRVRPRAPLAFGSAIVALNPEVCQGDQNGAIFKGGPVTTITGGGIFSNGCLAGDGGPDVTVMDGSINYVVMFNNNGGFNPNPQQVPVSIPPSAYDVPPPNCASPAAHNINASDLASLPQPLHGLYCVTGDLEINDDLSGNGVTIYMIDGELQISEDLNVQLTAPPYSPNPAPAVPGLLLYLPASNTNGVLINSDASDSFSGTILAPSSKITIQSTAGVNVFHMQVIGRDVSFSGDGEFNIIFDEKEQYSDPAYLELFK